MRLVNNTELNRWLEELKVEHRDLDEVIHHLIETRHHDTMRIQRLKKHTASAQGHDGQARKRVDSGPGRLSQTSLTVAISSRALFDLNESNRIFETEGLEAYRRFQIEHEDQVLEPGDGFVFVEKLLNFNKLLGKHRVEIILLSRNTADTGLRIFNSIAAHDLRITRAAFCGGQSPYRYVRAFGCDLFLSTHTTDVRHALEHGVAAATLLPAPARAAGSASSELRLAFDGDAVLFSDQSERVFQEQGP